MGYRDTTFTAEAEAKIRRLFKERERQMKKAIKVRDTDTLEFLRHLGEAG